MNTVRIDSNDAESGYATQGLVGLFDANGNQAIRLQSQTVGLGPEISMFRDTPSVETVELIAAETANEGARVQLRDVDGTTTIDLDAHTSGSGSKIALSTIGGTNTLLMDSNASGGPEIRLGTSSSPKILLDASDSENGYAGAGVIEVWDEGGHPAIRLHATGIPGTDTTPWTSSGKISLFKDDGIETVRIVGSDGDSTGQGGQVALYDGSNQRTIEIDSAEGSGGGAFVKLANADGKVTIELDADYGGSGGPGRVITQELEITGGSDLSEQFEITAPGGQPQPGQVVSIDPKRPGQLRVSARSYDRTVAGVISGAGGIRPGMLMGQRQSVADGAHPVALTGRVWCLCDTSSGIIEPGDLLTTSARPGHAMRAVDHQRAQGAIIGKAMSALKEGQGLVLVLVNLQ